MEYTCIDKIKNNSGITTHFILQDKMKLDIIEVDKEKLKKLLISNSIQIDNIKLSINNKIICAKNNKQKSLFDWNDAIATMNNGTEQIKALLKALYNLRMQGVEFVCIMYTSQISVGFSEIQSIEQLRRFIYTVSINMVYIKNRYDEEIQIYTFDLSSFYINNNILHVKFTKENKERIIRLV